MRPYRAKNRFSFFHRKSSCCLIEKKSASQKSCTEVKGNVLHAFSFELALSATQLAVQLLLPSHAPFQI